MSLSAAAFSDPALRPQLEKYYENKKTEIIDAINSRPPAPEEVKFTDANGQTQTAKLIPITGEQMAKAMVPFDKWLEFQAQTSSFQQKNLDMAQQRLDMLKQTGPDTPSHVKATFSDGGTLLAAINDDGTFMCSNADAPRLQGLAQKADDLGLSGQSRVDYLSRAFKNILSEDHKNLNATTYTDATSPTKRAFAQKWYPGTDVDQNYNDALADAKASLENAKQWHAQWQGNMNEIQNFLIGLQEAA